MGQVILGENGAVTTVAHGDINSIAKSIGGKVVDSDSIAPEPKPIQQQIVDLENSITERNKREYVKGLKYPTDERFFYSVKKIDKVDADIELLRAEL